MRNDNHESRPGGIEIKNTTKIGVEFGIKISIKSVIRNGIRSISRSESKTGLRSRAGLESKSASMETRSKLKAGPRLESKVRQNGFENRTRIRTKNGVTIGIIIKILIGRYIR
ncbi:hypothetical protein EVAR_7700_1 [Eumeta japonica]|uniref:Uncharacterized protein n=1 Tax=Eumeta variegata TaxID=151549 RepID=A0A4C1TLU4_EUMVA|nr:hypothetical protein EVAR_7700_1 [Eumeta japonica]